METIEISLKDSEYKILKEIAENNHTTIEKMFNKYIKLCIEEKGLVVWDNYNSYKVLKTEKECREFMERNNL